MEASLYIDGALLDEAAEKRMPASSSSESPRAPPAVEREL